MPGLVVGFPASTHVNTAWGYVPIGDVTRNDLLLGHSGQLRRITATQRAIYDGPMYTILVKGHEGRPISCTPTHRFYTRTRDEPTPSWTEARQLTTDHYVGLPVDQRSTIPLIGDLLLTPAHFWVLGYVMADARLHSGPTNGKHVLVRRADKDAVLPRLAEVALTKVKCETNGYCLLGLDAPWLEVAWKEFNGGAVLPDGILGAPERHAEAFVNGFMAMCARANGDVWAMFVTDPRAALGLQRLLHKLGHAASVHTDVRWDSMIGECANGCEVLHYVSVRTSDRLWVEEGIAWHRVASVHVDEVGPHVVTQRQVVHNFEVDTDNSYAVENITVHDCVF